MEADAKLNGMERPAIEGDSPVSVSYQLLAGS